MSTTTRPVVKTTMHVRTYLGARAVVHTEHHDSSSAGLRTITTEWIDDATAENGGYKAGTVTRRVIKGDGRYVEGPKACIVVEAEAIVSEAVSA